MPRTVRRALAAVLTLLTGASVSLSGPVPEARAAGAAPGGRDATAVLFQWRYDAVARECGAFLGPAGYGYVQVSPPQEHIAGPQWWTSYQPVSYRIAGRLGDRASFARMVNACHRAGVKVVVDAVLNHMSAGSGTGTGGTAYTKYGYPGTYGDDDFHRCRRPVSDYTRRDDVQNCELVGLADLDTGSERVRDRLARYLDDLLALGADGFRIDAAKHVPSADLAAVKARLSKPDVYWKQETIYGAGEAVQPEEYLGTGDVQEFRYARELKRVMTQGRLAELRSLGEGRGWVPGGKASVFVDNWDTERDGSTLNRAMGPVYGLANVAMLALPYGSPDVHSGYAFTDRDAGAPSGGWTYEHRRPETAGMVAFRNAVRGSGVGHWWDDGGDAVAFGRGAKGFVVINHGRGVLSRTFATGLPAGEHCDVLSGRRVRVGRDGRLTARVGVDAALAVVVEPRSLPFTVSCRG
ncbi:alpha-amylase [Streptomyces sp. URMC 126]|uniref:alpha-amylase n=1 Tax=Streptomyces sp. URMC 126 TaxID=3423401 RepID=UPI003F1BBA41